MRDADGNVTHYVINDTGTGTSGRMVPADQYHQSLDTGPAAVTDAPIRTPAAARETAPATEDTPASPEGTTAPRAASSRGDPSLDDGETENALGADAENSGIQMPDAGASEAGSSAEARSATSDPQGAGAADAEGKGDPTVQFGDRPGGLEGGEDESSSENPSTADPAETQNNYYKAVAAKTSLPKAFDGKTVLSDNGKLFVSGSGGKTVKLPTGYSQTSVADTQAYAKSVGRDFPNHMFDNGTPGSFYASHADAQALAAGGGEKAGITQPICGSCQNLYQKSAIARGEVLTPRDSNGEWSFNPDGTVLRPDGEVIGPNDEIMSYGNPGGKVIRSDGSILSQMPPKAAKP